MNQDNIGKFILELRTSKGWTQEDLANMIPITRQAVSRWEQGKSIPDSSTLVILSEIFDVSINELLSGRRIPKKEIVKESEKIALEIIDKNISMKKKIKRILISFISLFFIGIIGFLCYYFFATYNSVKVYSIGGKSKNFYLQEGVMIVTKQKLFFKLGNLIHSDDIDIDKITLSFKKNGKDKLIYDNKTIDKLIIENYGYEEFFYFEDLNDILKGINSNINSRVLENTSNEEVINIISSLNTLIAMRYHACLIAIKSQVKLLPISYDIKVESLANLFDLKSLSLGDLNQNNKIFDEFVKSKIIYDEVKIKNQNLKFDDIFNSVS